jgi:hypothetical protein
VDLNSLRIWIENEDAPPLGIMGRATEREHYTKGVQIWDTWIVKIFFGSWAGKLIICL